MNVFNKIQVHRGAHKTIDHYINQYCLLSETPDGFIRFQ